MNQQKITASIVELKIYIYSVASVRKELLFLASVRIIIVFPLFIVKCAS